MRTYVWPCLVSAAPTAPGEEIGKYKKFPWNRLNWMSCPPPLLPFISPLLSVWICWWWRLSLFIRILSNICHHKLWASLSSFFLFSFWFRKASMSKRERKRIPEDKGNGGSIVLLFWAVEYWGQAHYDLNNDVKWDGSERHGMATRDTRNCAIIYTLVTQFCDSL